MRAVLAKEFILSSLILSFLLLTAAEGTRTFGFFAGSDLLRSHRAAFGFCTRGVIGAFRILKGG
jgi:hypothetical protein